MSQVMNQVTKGEGYVRPILLPSNLVILVGEGGNFLVFVMDRDHP